ncbi:MAG: DUF262 domain-containing protein [Candidatus Atabeyarchaeum deiterrae]
MDAKINKIDANERTVRQLLDKAKYTVDVFQREYKWERPHIEQLLSDLTGRFTISYRENHQRKDVQKYRHYFLGPIILSQKGDLKFIIDGQQRLTSLTLLLIYLNNLQKNRSDQVWVNDMIFSEMYGEKSYNLQIDDRKDCIDALYNNSQATYDVEGKGESVKNIIERYGDIDELFPPELKAKALPYFIDWLMENVVLVEIVTYSDEDAYQIFETMNNRGLDLTSVEMLKGYLLSSINDGEQQKALNETWKKTVLELSEIGYAEDIEFFKTWLRAKYAEKQGTTGNPYDDFEKIGAGLHSWLRDNRDSIGLKTEKDFVELIKDDVPFYAKLYRRIHAAERELAPDSETMYYIGKRGFTLSYPLLIATIKKTDDENTMKRKLQLVSRFLETYIVLRSVNNKTLAYNSISYSMFNLLKEIRDKDVGQLSQIFKDRITSSGEKFDRLKDLELTQNRRRFIHWLLARITSYLEQKSKMPNRFREYTSRELAKPYQIEHIWSDSYEEHKNEAKTEEEFKELRNRIGGLLLVPEGFNQSYGNLPYEQKLPHYDSQNLLARTLNPNCYNMNPNFLKYKEQSGLPLKPHDHFSKRDLLERTELYQKICEEVWSLQEFDKITKSEE